jgi:hypothetical protein
MCISKKVRNSSLTALQSPSLNRPRKFYRVTAWRWRLAEAWVTPFGVIPAGFETDGASVPRFLWWFASPTGKLFEASIIHDWHYQNAINTKKAADAAFFITARKFGVGYLKARTAWLAVRLFGRGSY